MILTGGLRDLQYYVTHGLLPSVRKRQTFVEMIKACKQNRSVRSFRFDSMWPLGVVRTLKHCNRGAQYFKKYCKVNACSVLNYERIGVKNIVTSVCKDLSCVHSQNGVLRRICVIDRKNLANTRHMAVDAESIPPPYEYIDPKSEEEVVNVTFIYQDGSEQKVRGKVGDNLLLLALRHQVNIEGACEAQLACTSCHVYVDEKYQEFLEEKGEEEDDLLDNAPFLKENSRLGCQIILKKELDGLRLTVPKATINFYVDGHVPKH